MDVDRWHETPTSETKIIYYYSNNSKQSISIFISSPAMKKTLLHPAELQAQESQIFHNEQWVCFNFNLEWDIFFLLVDG